jgi:ribosomal protein S18 acetylase RimI-like enzyme
MKGFLNEYCTLSPVNEDILSMCNPFCCGDKELDNFFANQAVDYDKQMLGNSYCYRLNENPQNIVCAFTLANASMDTRNLPNSRRKKVTENIPHEKTHGTYPAALIGRLAVSSAYQGNGIGTEALDFIKFWIAEPPNKTACRFLTVDANNDDAVLRFYQENDFKFLFSTEQQEKQHIMMPPCSDLKTRLMFFDLMQI